MKIRKVLVVTAILAVITFLGTKYFYNHYQGPDGVLIGEYDVVTESIELESEPSVEVVQIETTSSPEIVPEAIVVDVTPSSISSETKQKLQDDPVIPEVTAEPPKMKENADVHDPNVKPEYEEVMQPIATPKPEEVEVVTKPLDEGGHENQIYVIGFGWVDYSGPSRTIDAPEIALNGNKVGDM